MGFASATVLGIFVSLYTPVHGSTSTLPVVGQFYETGNLNTLTVRDLIGLDPYNSTDRYPELKEQLDFVIPQTTRVLILKTERSEFYIMRFLGLDYLNGLGTLRVPANQLHVLNLVSESETSSPAAAEVKPPHK